MRNPFKRQQPRGEPRPLMGAAAVATQVAPTLLQGVQQPWQSRARLFAARLGIVSFAQMIPCSAGSRCRYVIQERVANNQWKETMALTPMLEWYRNDAQSFAELIDAHIFRLGVDGDRWECLIDGETGLPNYYVLPNHLLSWTGPKMAQVNLAPNGSEAEGTMVRLPTERVTRMWIPSRDYPLLGTSPLEPVLEDCETYWALRRFVKRTAESRLAMNRIVWTPEEAHSPLPPEMQQAGAAPISELDVQLATIARRSWESDDTVQGIMPFFLRYANALQPPKLLDLAHGLEPQILDALARSGRDIANGLPLPSEILLSEQQNHWSQWLTDEQSFRWGIAPPVERTCWDITKSFLWPTLRAMAARDSAIGDVERFRVWYDSSTVVVAPDRTSQALPLNMAGLLAAIPTLEAYGYGQQDLMNDAERKIWKDFRGAVAKPPPGGAPGEAMPAGPGNAPESAPPEPAQVGSLNPFEAEMVSWYANGHGNGHGSN